MLTRMACAPHVAGKPIMSNEEFDVLKQELLWEGSKVAVLTSSEQVRCNELAKEVAHLVQQSLTTPFHVRPAAEQKFLEAVMMYNMGKPTLSDAEFDALKLKLLEQGSPIAVKVRRLFVE